MTDRFTERGMVSHDAAGMTPTHRDGLQLGRRGLLLGGLAGLCASQPAWSSPAWSFEPGFFRRHGLPIGLQLSTLGKSLTMPLDRMLARVARVGYRTVELPGLMSQTPEAWRSALDRAGLRCTSLHSPLGQNIAQVVQDARVIGCDHIIQPMFDLPAGASFDERAGESRSQRLERLTRLLDTDFWRKTADMLNRTGRALRQEDMRVGYHNHNIEFAPLASGDTGMDMLLRETDPSQVTFEVDLGWVAAAGLDPAAFLARHDGRFKLAHVKDVSAQTHANFGFDINSTPVGSGILPWRRILPAAFAAGVREFFVEQDGPVVDDRYEGMASSFHYLSELTA